MNVRTFRTSLASKIHVARNPGVRFTTTAFCGLARDVEFTRVEEWDEVPIGDRCRTCWSAMGSPLAATAGVAPPEPDPSAPASWTHEQLLAYVQDIEAEIEVSDTVTRWELPKFRRRALRQGRDGTLTLVLKLRDVNPEVAEETDANIQSDVAGVLFRALDLYRDEFDVCWWDAASYETLSDVIEIETVQLDLKEN